MPIDNVCTSLNYSSVMFERNPFGVSINGLHVLCNPRIFVLCACYLTRCPVACSVGQESLGRQERLGCVWYSYGAIMTWQERAHFGQECGGCVA